MNPQSQDFDYEPDPGELTDEKCFDKDCKGFLVKQGVMDGPDDYKWTYTCNICGNVESN